jgi:excisionase family DNA binding protein
MKNVPQEIETPLARSPEDAARHAGVGRTKIFEAIREGNLPARKLGRRTLVLDADLRAWLSNLPLAGSQASAA